MTEQRKLAAVMFTDIAGYTALMSRNEQKALQTLQKNRVMQKSLVKKYDGEFLKEMGDGTLLCFQSALDAVRCAMDIQNSVQGDPNLNLRIGIHLGDIVFKQGDIFGDGVNVASRIERLAESGCICISEEVYRSVRNQPEIDAVFLDEKILKNVDHPVKIYSIQDGGTARKSKDVIFKQDRTEEKSIIVLPFDDMSPDKDNEYFSDGLTEEIITDLSHIHDLLVISRSSAMTFKGTKKKIKEIAEEVNVQFVLEGSVRKAGNNLRITAQLIDATNDAHLWAEKYSGTLDDVFDIQEKVSRRIVDALKLKLSSKESEKLSERPIENILAYEYLFRAKDEFSKLTEKAFNRAIDYLKKALKLEGENTLLYAELAHSYYQFWNLGIRIEEKDLKQANIYVQKVFDLDRNSPHGHFVCGLLEITGGNAIKGISHFKRVLSEDPNHADALAWLSIVYSYLGITRESKQLHNRLSHIDPFHMFGYFTPIVIDIHTGKFNSAVKQAGKMNTSFTEEFALSFYAFTLMYNDQFEEAFTILDRIPDSFKEIFTSKIVMLFKYAYQSKQNEFEQLIDNKFKLWAKNDFIYSLWLGEAYALIDDNKEAFYWLENAVQRGFINYPFLNEYDPFLENIRGEERFKKLMKRVKREWENFEA